MWSQILARAISGPLAGERLEVIPITNTTWADWRARNPDTAVLSLDTGYRRDYTRDPYHGYENSAELLFPVLANDERLHPKEPVIGLEVDGRFKAYPFSELARTDGEIEDTLAAPTWDYEPPRVTASRGTSSSARRVPFTPDAVWSFSPLGYFVAGLSTDYRIDLYRRAAPVLRVERSAEPVPVNAAEAEERVRRITEGLRRQYGSWRWNGPDVPGVKPPFRELFVSAEGNLWVVVSREGVPRMTAAEAREEEARSGRIPLRFAEPPAFDVFAPDGTYLGHVTASGELRLQPEPVVIGDRLWAVTRDELDVASVARFRIRRP